MIMKRMCCFFMFMAALALTVACTDDDSFTTSPSHLLSFSTDSVALDTVFSAVPTATKSFWVYNKSGSGIRCSNIRLEKGNQTGFRVNVDGSFLGAASGFQINDLEIRDKDSVRVFVELTSPLNYQEQPTRIMDNLVFTLESGVQQKVNLNAFTWDAVMMTDVVVNESMTIEGDRPVIIYGGITVQEGATLNLSAGTTLYFHADAGIDVYGRLLVNGDVDHNVVLRGDRIDHMFDYLPYDNVSGQWKGIHFYQQSYENVINYADIHSASDAIVCDSAAVDKLKLSLYHSVVHNCKGAGVLSKHAVIDIQNCQVTNTLGDCVAIHGGVAQLMQCTIAQFYPFDANRGVALRFSNYYKEHHFPLYDFKCYNSIVTGYADDVIMGESVEEVPYTFLFDHCLLRTPQIEDAERIKEVVWEEPEDTIRGGVKNFANIDTDNLRYDFRLGANSLAIGAADPSHFMEYDRNGLRRDEQPDLGCYEYVNP